MSKAPPDASGQPGDSVDSRLSIQSATTKKQTPESSSGVFFSPEQVSAFESAGLWRANALASAEGPVCPTGYEELDACLPGGGWNTAGLTELLTKTVGVGELRLLMPALSSLTSANPGWVMWIAPPFLPNAPALQQWQVAPSRMLVIHPRTPRDLAWATEQALTSDNCIAVLVWAHLLDRTKQRGGFQRLSRRLQLAASEHRCWAVAFRGFEQRQTPSAAVLRIALTVNEDQRDLELLKVRGGRPCTVRNFDAGVDFGLGALVRP
ncbi:MAG: translesion DNA synthesis-associated protein ImuA [Pseudomonadota bacterium]